VKAGDRILRVSFESAEAFRQEYESNLSNGGVFVASGESFALREPVCVGIELCYAKRTVELRGEVVHTVPPEMASAGATPGVAVQFHDSAIAIRERLGPLVGARTAEPTEETDAGQRRAPRKQARVDARIDAGVAVLSGRTRNLSLTGALVGVRGRRLPPGERVHLFLRHPTTGEEMGVDARVVREVESDGELSAVAVEFEPDENERERLEDFISEIQNIEHTRRLGGIVGAIEALGPQSLVQMFAISAPEGTLYLRCGQEEGLIGFQAGLLRFARLGSSSGMKALVRMLSWREGSFEFHSQLEDAGAPEPPLPLEAALLDAVRQIDEGGRIDQARFPLQALTKAGSADPCDYDLSKVEAAVLDLAHVGFTVGRIIDVIPESDSEIFRALGSLADEQLVVIGSEESREA
jgi:Tfp pilus assembly protein PilZ